MFFRRKIYDRLLEWKRQSEGSSALFVEGRAGSANCPSTRAWSPKIPWRRRSGQMEWNFTSTPGRIPREVEAAWR